MNNLYHLIKPDGEKLFVKLIFTGMIFLTLTGLNVRFLPCNSPVNFCSFNSLNTGESYNIYSYITVSIVYTLIPLILSCLVVERFK